MKSGFISIIGRTNAGKSTLLNYLLGEKISLVSHKQNATRRKINAIVMQGDAQAIFVDTPGLNESQKIMNKLMVQSALNSIKDCDLILFVATIFDDLSGYENFLKILEQNFQNSPKIPHIVALTKIDLAKKEQIFAALSKYQKFSENFLAIVPISAKKQTYRKVLLDAICANLPQHEFYYDSEFLTTTNEREIFRDFILEAIFDCVSDEVPYFSDVNINKVTQKPEITEIFATIITDNAHHKAILIRQNGKTIKRIGIVARKLINNLTKSKVFLKIEIKIEKNWHSNEKKIKNQFNFNT